MRTAYAARAIFCCADLKRPSPILIRAKSLRIARNSPRSIRSICVFSPWPWLVINIIDSSLCVCFVLGLGLGWLLCVCVFLFWPWPRWLLCVLCVIVCVCLNGKPPWPWPRLVKLTMTCVCVCVIGLAWPRLVIIDNIASIRVCVCVFFGLGLVGYRVCYCVLLYVLCYLYVFTSIASRLGLGLNWLY